MLRGLPDLEQPIVEDGVTLLFPFEGGGPFVVSPDELEIARRRDGSVDFALEDVTGSSPGLPPEPFSVLDFKVAARHDLDRALAVARRHRAGAVVMPLAFSSGFLRLRPAVGSPSTAPLDARLFDPIALSYNGLGQARYVLRLPHDAGLALRAALGGEHLGVVAWAEMEFAGVSPRVPAQVTLDPATLVRALAPHARSDGRTITWKALVATLVDHAADLPLQVTGAAGHDHPSFAEAMADRIRERFARSVPSPVENEAALQLLTPEEAGSGRVRLDLSLPARALRPMTFRLDPFKAAREQVTARGIDSVVRKIRVPSFDLGMHSVEVLAQLPQSRRDVLSLSVGLQVPARPPQRPQAIHKTIDLKEPRDQGTVTFRLAPGERLGYTLTPAAIVRTPRGLRKLVGKPIPGTTAVAELGGEHFPVDFVPIEAGTQLLEVATVRGTCCRPAAVDPVEVPFTLDAASPTVTLVLPRDPAPAVLKVEAHPRDPGSSGDNVVRTTVGPAPGYCLDVYDFGEYGPQTVEIEAIPEPGQSLLAIDLLPVGAPETPTAITVLGFTPSQTRRRWTFLPDSIFGARYRYRLHLEGAPAPWSEPRLPTEPLRLGGAGGGRT